MEKLVEIPDKVTYYWESEIKSVVAIWQHYFIDENVFLEAIKKVLKHAKENHAVAWIVDASNAKGLFKPEFIEKLRIDFFPKLKIIGIDYVLSIAPKHNSFAKVNANKYKNEMKKVGMVNVEFKDIESAINWLHENWAAFEKH